LQSEFSFLANEKEISVAYFRGSCQELAFPSVAAFQAASEAACEGLEQNLVVRDP